MLIRRVLVLLLTFAVCASDAELHAASSAGDVPSNYRALVAQGIWQSTDRRTIRRARISPPEMAVGLFGESVVVCAEVFRQTPLFSDARDHWVFIFENGRITDARYSYSMCKRYSSFDDLLQ